MKKFKGTLCLVLSSVIVLLIALTGCQSNVQSSVYSEKNNWAYLENSDSTKDADVFLLGPTVYDGDSDNGIYNMSLDNDEIKESYLATINMQRGIYASNSRVFAPCYRQAGMNVYSLPTEQGEQYMAFALNDVVQAFQYYLDNYNNGRPIILAGFSQGADMCIRLMKKCFTDEKLQQQLVACYAIGWRITQEEVDEFSQLKCAVGEDDTGVIISYNSEALDVTDSLMVPSGVKTLAINPLNWKTDDTVADKELNLGACFIGSSGEVKSEIPQFTGAYIDKTRGTLKVTDVDANEFSSSAFESGIYHIYDFQFFYRNLQKNIETRLNAYMSK